MKFIDIKEDSKVFPGEYLYYEPKSMIVLCGAFNRENNFIRAFGHGRYLEDQIDKFKKIEMDKVERKAFKLNVTKCKKCGK
jgi:hypothetical protein|tara:strand:- start:2177 stop:2419 length:243 start_codon:yes stop_codon:yes gene_type:complete